MGKDPLGGYVAHAMADLNASGDLRARGGRSTGVPYRLVQQVLEINAALLKTGGIYIGEIVGNSVNFELLRSHA